MEHTNHDEMMPPTRKSQASTLRTLSSSSTKTPTEQITENFHANDAASSCNEVDVSSEKGPPTIDGSSEEYHDNSFANENPLLLEPSTYQTPPSAPMNSNEEAYSTKYYADGTSPNLPICGLCSQNSNDEEIGKMPHFIQQEEFPIKDPPNEAECPDYDEDGDDDEIYIITHDENSMVSGVTLPSDVWTVSSSVINNFEFSSPMPPFSNLHQKQILSPLSESGSEVLHSETLQPPSSPPPSSSASSEPVVGNEQDPQIHHLSRLISQQEELLEKTRQLNDKRKILLYSNIALIIAVALAVGLALGLGRSGDQNDNNQIERGNHSDTSTQQNEMEIFDHHPSESPSNDPLDDQGNPPVASDDSLCHPVEVYAEMLSENDLASMAEETVSWSIHDKLTNVELRSGNFEPDSVFYGLEEGDGEVLEDSFCLPNGSFSFRVDGTPFLKNGINPEIYLALRTKEGTFNGHELGKPEILASVEMKDELVATDFSIPPSVDLPSIQPSTHRPTINPATSTPSSLPSTVPSTHPSFRPSETSPPEVSSSPSSSLNEDYSRIPSSQSSSMPTADHVAEFLCYQVGFEITADNNASNITASVVAMPPADVNSENPASIDASAKKMILFESGALEPNSSFQYNECLPPSEYSVIILSNGDHDCCRGHYVVSVEAELSGSMDPSPLSTLRNSTVVNSWDVTTFPLPFKSSSLNALEILASFISYASSNDTNDDLSWEVLHNGKEVASTNSFPYNSIADHSAYREMKYLSTGEYQFIGHNVQVGSFRLTSFDGFNDLGVWGDQIISTALRNVHFHSVTFTLPLDMNRNHLLEVYFETPSSYGPEIYWEVRNAGDESTVLTTFSPYENHETYLEAKYLSLGSYVFVVYDFTSQGLGDVGHFELLLDGDIIHNFDSNTSKSWYQYDFSFEVS